MNCTLCMNGLKHEESLKKKIFLIIKLMVMLVMVVVVEALHTPKQFFIVMDTQLNISYKICLFFA